MKISRLLFWILFPLCFIIMSLLLVFYLDIANGPNACFVIMILLLICLFTTQIVIRNTKMKFRLLSWAVFILLATIDLLLAYPRKEYKSAVEYKNPLRTNVLTLNDGRVQGVKTKDEAVEVYAGIPYAKAPVGDLRWKEPQDVNPWDDVLDCSKFKSSSMQPYPNQIVSSLTDIFAEKGWHPDFYEHKLEYTSEDSLYVNIWKPEGNVSNLPVLIYYHGGSLTTGTPSFYSYNGEQMARKGIIQVNVGYRLGVFGYLALDELQAESSNNTTGNYGLLDQIKALEWVYKNISAFGGDNKNITIAGESAGSSSVSAICSSPLAKGLFQRAIGESSSVVVKTPPHTFRTLSDAKKVGNSVLKEFGAKNVAELRKISADELVKTKSTNSSMTVDGYALPKSPYELYREGLASDVPLLNGFNSQEADAFTIPNYLTSGQPNKLNSRDRLIETFKDASLVDRMMSLRDFSTDKAAFRSFNDIISAYWFAYPHYSWDRMIEDKYTSNVYTYYFNKNNGYYSGYHSGELVYVFNNLKSSLSKTFAYNDSDYKLAETMNNAWVNFIKTGNPSSSNLTWQPWESSKFNVMNFGEKAEMITDPYKDLYPLIGEFIG